MANTTEREFDPRLLERMREEARHRGVDLDALLEKLLARALDANTASAPHAELWKHSGSWTVDEELEYIANAQISRGADESLRA